MFTYVSYAMCNFHKRGIKEICSQRIPSISLHKLKPFFSRQISKLKKKSKTVENGKIRSFPKAPQGVVDVVQHILQIYQEKIAPIN